VTNKQTDSAVKTANGLKNNMDLSVSPQTIRRTLKSSGFKSVVKKKRPLLSTKNKRARYDFAIAHQHWAVEDWKQVI